MIKYRGGKSKELANYINLIPNNFDRFIEPFFGGGATYFYLEPEIAIINDINARVMNFYSDVRNNYDLLKAQLRDLQNQYEHNQANYQQLKNLTPNERVPNLNEDLYYHIRDLFNNPENEAEYLQSVVYYFINKTAYSGMIRYNKQGQYNVPFGRYQNFNTDLITEGHCRLLQGAEIHNEDYSNIFNLAQGNDFIYLDPPYDCTFNDYGNFENQEDGFSETEHRRLAQDFRNLPCRAMMIIGRTPLIEELYGNNIRGEYAKSYAVNIRNRFKSEANHVIVTNYNV